MTIIAEPLHPSPVRERPPSAPAGRRRAAFVGLLYRAFFGVAGLGATAYSYMAIVSLFLELDAPHWVAWGLGGFIEAGLIGSALGALHAVLTRRDPALFMTLTWTLSFTTGGLAAWHETMTRPDPAIWVALRLIVPFLAAVFWHVLLTGASHLNAGVNPVTAILQLLSHTRASLRAWRKERKAESLMHDVIRAVEDVRAAQAGDDGRTSIPTRHRRQLTTRQLHDREREARDAALRVLGIAEYRERYAAWVRDLRATDIARTDTAQFGGPVTDSERDGGADDTAPTGVTGTGDMTRASLALAAQPGAARAATVTPASGPLRPTSSDSPRLAPRQPEPVSVRPVPPGPRNARGLRHGTDGTAASAKDHDDVLEPMDAAASTSDRAARARELQGDGVDFEVICSIVGRSRRTVFRYLAGEDSDTPPHGVPIVPVPAIDAVSSEVSDTDDLSLAIVGAVS